MNKMLTKYCELDETFVFYVLAGSEVDMSGPTKEEKKVSFSLGGEGNVSATDDDTASTESDSRNSSFASIDSLPMNGRHTSTPKIDRISRYRSQEDAEYRLGFSNTVS